MYIVMATLKSNGKVVFSINGDQIPAVYWQGGGIDEWGPAVHTWVEQYIQARWQDPKAQVADFSIVPADGFPYLSI